MIAHSAGATHKLEEEAIRLQNKLLTLLQSIASDISSLYKRTPM